MTKQKQIGFLMVYVFRKLRRFCTYRPDPRCLQREERKEKIVPPHLQVRPQNNLYHSNPRMHPLLPRTLNPVSCHQPSNNQKHLQHQPKQMYRFLLNSRWITDRNQMKHRKKSLIGSSKNWYKTCQICRSCYWRNIGHQ